MKYIGLLAIIYSALHLGHEFGISGEELMTGAMFLSGSYILWLRG